jgi:hypothetical protein
LTAMSTLAEIEEAIEALPPHDVEALAVWLQRKRQGQAKVGPVDEWLARARGTAASGVTTQGVLAMTRAEE